jgi:hypothetical protein
MYLHNFLYKAMKNINFATRVSVKLVPKAEAGNSANALRQELHTLINKHKIAIDFTVFSKTEVEKEELKVAKAKWKLAQ